MFNFLAQNYLTRGFWGDEAWTSMISRLPYTQMLKTTAGDFHPPGYYTIIELLYKFLAPTEVNTRFVSIAFFLLTIFMVYKLASYVRSHMFGAFSAIVVATNPIFFRYAFEARNYTMFAFAATGSIFFLLELSKKFTLRQAQGKQKSMLFPSVMFVLFTTLGVYTHYYMIFILAAQGIYLLLFDRKIFWRLVSLYAIVGVLFLPWLRVLIGQILSVKSSYWIPPIDFRNTYFDAFERILGGEDQSIWRTLLFSISIIVILAGVARHLILRKFEKPYLLIWLWALVPFVLASLPGLSIGGLKLPFRPIFFWRYLIGASIPLSMIVVHGIDKLPKEIFKIVVSIIIVLSLIIDFATFSSQPKSFREIYKDQVIGKVGANEQLVTVLPSFAEVIYYRDYFKLANPLIILPEGLVQFSGKSLLDTYSEDKIVTIENAPKGHYFYFDQGPILEIR